MKRIISYLGIRKASSDSDKLLTKITLIFRFILFVAVDKTLCSKGFYHYITYSKMILIDILYFNRLFKFCKIVLQDTQQ